MIAQLKQISDHVWYLPADRDASKVQAVVGVIIGKDETILVDAGNTPKTAQHIMGELNRLNAPAISKVIYTHHHWDHVFGGCAYDAEIIGHAYCKAFLQREVNNAWSPAFLRQQAIEDPTLQNRTNMLIADVEDWATFHIALPTTTFIKPQAIAGNGFQLVLEHVGGKHSADSITVSVVGESVMFLSDCFYQQPLRENPTETRTDFAMLRRFLDSGYNTFVHGHGMPISREALARWLASNDG